MVIKNKNKLRLKRCSSKCLNGKRCKNKTKTKFCNVHKRKKTTKKIKRKRKVSFGSDIDEKLKKCLEDKNNKEREMIELEEYYINFIERYRKLLAGYKNTHDLYKLNQVEKSENPITPKERKHFLKLIKRWKGDKKKGYRERTQEDPYLREPKNQDIMGSLTDNYYPIKNLFVDDERRPTMSSTRSSKRTKNAF